MWEVVTACPGGSLHSSSQHSLAGESLDPSHNSPPGQPNTRLSSLKGANTHTARGAPVSPNDQVQGQLIVKELTEEER